MHDSLTEISSCDLKFLFLNFGVLGNPYIKLGPKMPHPYETPCNLKVLKNEEKLFYHPPKIFVINFFTKNSSSIAYLGICL